MLFCNIWYVIVIQLLTTINEFVIVNYGFYANKPFTNIFIHVFMDVSSLET